MPPCARARIPRISASMAPSRGRRRSSRRRAPRCARRSCSRRSSSTSRASPSCAAPETPATTFDTELMPILDRIAAPADLKSLSREELKTLADEMRARLIDVCSRTGGHIGAGLGVVELTVAIHAAFDAPRDQIVWDVGHQGYPHKLLTGRNDGMETLRQEGGLSGFLRRSESEYDPFGAGHAGTAISAAYGMAV